MNESFRELLTAVDTCNTLARYHQLLTLIEECFDQDIDQARTLLSLYSSNVEKLFETLAESLNHCYLEMHLIKNQELISRADRHLKQFRESFPDAVAITVHDTDESKGYPYLDVYAPIPERLNQRRDIILGRPVSFLPRAISAPRHHYIKRALANGQSEEYSYEYEDDYLWKFDVTVVPIYGTEEVVTVVRDAEPWQLGHWLNKLS
jgi:hypothetical protein